jgi:hypothetical protein
MRSVAWLAIGVLGACGLLAACSLPAGTSTAPAVSSQSASAPAGTPTGSAVPSQSASAPATVTRTFQAVVTSGSATATSCQPKQQPEQAFVARPQASAKAFPVKFFWSTLCRSLCLLGVGVRLCDVGAPG